MTPLRSLAAALAAGALAIAPAGALAAAASTPTTPVVPATAGGAAAPAATTGAAVPPTTTLNPAASGTAQPGATTTPTATSTPQPGVTTPATPGASTTVTPGASTPEAPGTTTTAKAPAKSGGGISGWAILAAAVGALIVLGVLVWAVFRVGAYEPHWLASARHSAAEAAYRASATWAEFSDWARLGH